MAHHANTVESVGDRLRQVVALLPPGPFSRRDFVNHATGLNALAHEREVDPFLDQLVADGTIHRSPTNIAMWVVVAEERCAHSPTPARSTR